MEWNWHRILFNDEPYTFFFEILFRSIVVFIIVIIVLRLTGKRGVKQLSIYEVVFIITLGSAAGDAMFYKDVGLLHALMVLAFVLIAYRLIILLLTRSESAEEFLEGRATYVVRNGELALDDITGNELGLDEFFAELRSKGVEHLGQVRCAILEGTGTLSTFFYEDGDVKPGLPILPDEYYKKSKKIEHSGLYSCAYCGTTLVQTKNEIIRCKRCGKEEWVKAVDRKRIG